MALDRITNLFYITEKRAGQRAPRWYRCDVEGNTFPMNPQRGEAHLSDGDTVTRAREVPLGTSAIVTRIFVIVPPSVEGAA